MEITELPKNLSGKIIETETGCWEWQGSLGSHGYGDLRVDGQHWLVHRFVYSTVIGDIPEGLVIWHTCDNRKCCNPSHLRLGTQFQNLMDMTMKGRGNAGSRNGMAKLNREAVELIRDLYIKGKSQSELARDFNVNRSCIWKVVHGTRWR